MKEQIGVMLSSSEVENRISEMAAAIDKAYEGKTIHLIGILKGSVFFMCELATTFNYRRRNVMPTTRYSTATRLFASSILSSQKNKRCTTYPFSCALRTRLI